MTITLVLDLLALIVMFLAASAEFQRKVGDVNLVALGLAIWMLARLIV
jgi:hypothetical protein